MPLSNLTVHDNSWYDLYEYTAEKSGYIFVTASLHCDRADSRTSYIGITKNSDEQIIATSKATTSWSSVTTSGLCYVNKGDKILIAASTENATYSSSDYVYSYGFIIY